LRRKERKKMRIMFGLDGEQKKVEVGVMKTEMGEKGRLVTKRTQE
jgi:hypothetical protein